MSALETALEKVVTMSNTIGEKDWDAVILGEGNTSIAVDDESFLVKGSGCSLGTMGAADFVHLKRDTILSLLNEDSVNEEQLKACYESAKIDPNQNKRPSVETVFHALALSYDGVNAVAHTHATAVNMITVTPKWQEHLQGRLFPDEAVVLGRDSVFVPYVDPGVILAKAIKDGIDGYLQQYGEVPKVIYMQNHGVIALGANCTEAENITAMAIKAARIRLGAIQAGGFECLPTETIEHLLGRPDEKYRQQVLA